MKKCDNSCSEPKNCSWHRVHAMTKANKVQFKELEAALDQTEALSIQLEKIDLKSASRKAAKKRAAKKT